MTETGNKKGHVTSQYIFGHINKTQISYDHHSYERNLSNFQYMKHFIFHGVIRTHKWPAPSTFHAYDQ